MESDRSLEVFKYHRGGKIGVTYTKSLATPYDLSLAYTPGVAEICTAIHDDPQKVYDLTIKHNSVAVVTDGTAVLGLGNIGAKASIPVMEGKALLFKLIGKIDAWPVPLENVHHSDGTTDPQKLIEVVKSLSCLYGGINLEDIAAPACFEVEDRLSQDLDIPVMHDDQWGSAIIILAAFKNYLIITEKKADQLQVVINGAGAAGLRCAELLKGAGVTNLILCDSKGVIQQERSDLNQYKQKFAVKTKMKSLKDAMFGADIFIGLSIGNCVTKEMVLSMNIDHYPAIFALANPVPEISCEAVEEALKGKTYLMATGRSDYPNQVNNALGFPLIFRGALDAKAKKITLAMKLAAADAIARLAREKELPLAVKKAYPERIFEFGPKYFIPTLFDPRLIEVASAVQIAATVTP